LIESVQGHIDRPSFPFYLAFAAFLDVFLLVVPTDGIVVSSAMARPKRWFVIFAGVTTGSILGVLLLGAIVYWDADVIKGLAPWIFQSEAWEYTKNLLQHWGFWAVFLGGFGFLPPTQPFIIIPILAEMHFGHWFLAFSIARVLKFLSFAWIASHSPKLVSRFKIFRLELDDVAELAAKAKDKETGK
jgi:membrane protein YqaA with SNARE-associated domain